jgi:hypothetical protein
MTTSAGKRLRLRDLVKFISALLIVWEIMVKASDSYLLRRLVVMNPNGV